MLCILSASVIHVAVYSCGLFIFKELNCQLIGKARLFPTVLVVYLSPAVYKNSSFCPFSSSLSVFHLFHFIYSDGWLVISYCVHVVFPWLMRLKFSYMFIKNWGNSGGGGRISAGIASAAGAGPPTLHCRWGSQCWHWPSALMRTVILSSWRDRYQSAGAMSARWGLPGPRLVHWREWGPIPTCP